MMKDAALKTDPSNKWKARWMGGGCHCTKMMEKFNEPPLFPLGVLFIEFECQSVLE